MEGLIPMVYNAMKKKKKMKYYTNLSSGSKLYTDTDPHTSTASTTDRFFMSPQPEDYKSRNETSQYQERFFYTPQRENLGTNHGSKKHAYGNLPPLPREPLSPRKKVNGCKKDSRSAEAIHM